MHANHSIAEPVSRSGIPASIDARPDTPVINVVIYATLLVSLVIRLGLLTGPLGSDDVFYLRFANKLWDLESFDELSHHGGRLLFLLTIGLPAAIFDSILVGATANVFLLSLRDILIVSYLRSRLDSTAAMSAAAVLGLNGISTVYAGLMLPDGLLSLCMFFCVALAYEAVSSSARNRVWSLLGAGILAGASYSVKDTGILIAPCALGVILLAHSRWKSQSRRALLDSCVFVAGGAALVMVEMAVYYFLSGDALYRIHSVAWTHNTVGDVVEAKSLYDFARSVYWNALTALSWNSTSMPVLLTASVIWPITLLKRIPLTYFSIVGLFLGVYLIAGTSSFTRLIPLPVQDRYFEILVPFLATSIAALVHSDGLVRSPRGKLAFAVVLPLLIVLTSVPAIIVRSGDLATVAVSKNAAIAIKAVHGARPQATVYVSPKLRRALEPFLPRNLHSRLRIPEDSQQLATGFYVYYPGWRANEPYQDMIEELPDYIMVAEDHRKFARLAPSLRDHKIVVKYVQ